MTKCEEERLFKVATNVIKNKDKITAFLNKYKISSTEFSDQEFEKFKGRWRITKNGKGVWIIPYPDGTGDVFIAHTSKNGKMLKRPYVRIGP